MPMPSKKGGGEAIVASDEDDDEESKAKNRLSFYLGCVHVFDSGLCRLALFTSDHHEDAFQPPPVLPLRCPTTHISPICRRRSVVAHPELPRMDRKTFLRTNQCTVSSPAV